MPPPLHKLPAQPRELQSNTQQGHSTITFAVEHRCTAERDVQERMPGLGLAHLSGEGCGRAEMEGSWMEISPACYSPALDWGRLE